MKKFIAFPSIDQENTVTSHVLSHAAFVGKDANGEPIYDATKPKPVITYVGTVKLHGTNAGVCYNDVADLWAQSRSNIITPQNDNYGFAFFVESKKEAFVKLIKQIAEDLSIDLTTHTISVFGE